MEIPPQRRKRDARGSLSGVTNAGPGNQSGHSLSLKLLRPTEYLYGKLNVQEFLTKLNTLGISDVRLVEQGGGSFIIHLVSRSKNGSIF